jgi:predicted membrane protein
MANASKTVRAVFKGIAKANSVFSIELGPIRATGVPAILVAVTGIVLGGGVASMLARSASRLPETLGEARALVETLRGDRARLSR